jgi:CRP/FNR family transcriptional regulator, cyclic AMP receptor protein
MSLADVLGYIAAFLVFLTFSMKTMVPLRIVGICSNVFFIAYGYLGPAYPLLVLHLALLPLNIFRLRQMLTLVRQIGEATKGDLNMDWLKPFTTKREVKAGDILFRKSDKADSMYFVMSGEFRIAELGVAIGTGQVIGELGLLEPDQIRTQTVECIKDADVLHISYDQVKQLYFQNPKFGFFFLQLTSRRLFENVARLEKRLAKKGS